MKYLFLIQLLLSTQALAANSMEPIVHESCIINEVTASDRQSSGLIPEINLSLLQKGYRIIKAGNLYKNYNVRVDDLEVRDELLKPGSILAITRSSIFGEPNETGCTQMMPGRPQAGFDCSTRLDLYFVSSEKDLVLFGQIYAPEYDRLTTNPAAAKKKILALAEANIPLCKLKNNSVQTESTSAAIVQSAQ